MADKNEVKVQVTLEITVDPEWIEFCTKYNDLFRTDHCGYWMYGMEREDALGWLVYVHDEEKNIRQVARHPEYPTIVQAWRDGKELPDRWKRLNAEAAIQAYKHGVERSGAEWYENGDATDYDVAIQMALLGEVVYG